MSKLFRVIVIAFVLGASLAEADACQIGWRSPAELQAEAGIVATVVIISAAHLRTSFRGEDYEYRVRVESVERGELKLGELRTTHEDLKAHLRGTTRVCPLKNGSGIEHDLKPGARYHFFVRSNSDPEILFAKPTEK
jgi:hypothetical protein